MLVRTRMSHPAVTIRQDAELHEALQLMQRKRLRRLPVVDADGRLAGIVVERDLLLAATRFTGVHIELAEIMTHNVVTATPDMTLTQVARTMLELRIGGLPVVENGEIVGMITESDIFRRFVEMSA
ncbi:MAG TPA: CBS domain-containing protein [Casimicrobiaceae bacterium]|nr:CBS domain-containing protein [Casimicrobiaceae bacterium]